MTSMFDPITLGAIRLPNRIVMAPLTRNRATMPGRVPNALMRDYYVQRASAGLILTEASSVDPQGVGYPSTPGCWSDEQTQGWKQIVDGVHAAGGRIMMQLWHVGRISDPVYHDGQPTVAPSALAPEGHVSLLRPKRLHSVPRALETEEVPGVVAAFRRGAENAKKAGFDGVEIHGANGYLIDQFLQDGSNKRTDRYGGPVENRARLMLDVADACISVWGAGKVGMHLAPRCDAHDMGDSDPAKTFGYVAEQLGRRKIAFVFARGAARQAEDRLRLRTRIAEGAAARAAAEEDVRGRLDRQRRADGGKRAGRARRRRGGRRVVRQGFHLQRGPGRPVEGRRADQRLGHEDLLFGRGGGLHRLSDAGDRRGLAPPAIALPRLAKPGTQGPGFSASGAFAPCV